MGTIVSIRFWTKDIRDRREPAGALPAYVARVTIVTDTESYRGDCGHVHRSEKALQACVRRMSAGVAYNVKSSHIEVLTVVR